MFVQVTCESCGVSGYVNPAKVDTSVCMRCGESQEADTDE